MEQCGIGNMKFCFIGEAMIEISGNADNCKMGFAGDTLNTAVHLARFGHEVSYFTAIGNDDFSNDFVKFLARENVAADLIVRHPTRHMGLYTIKLDNKGERTFQYWRENSAAKEVLTNSEVTQLVERLSHYDYVCFSLISVAILSQDDRNKLFGLCAELRANGVKIVFDGNYRPKLWQSRKETQKCRDIAISQCDIGLPTFEDEVAVSGFNSIEECADFWHQTGARELVVKDGAGGCLVNSKRVLPDKELNPIDTSGAGDAFNAGYLSARANGKGPEIAAKNGHSLAGWVIMNKGAIPKKPLKDSVYDK